MTDYIGAAMAKPGDLMQYGRKGMKWGQRIFTKGKDSDSADGKAASKTGGATSAPAKRPPGNIQDNVESSSARYDRLATQARTGRAHEMTEQDLKFFNARTEALNKINKMNETQPSWLRETATKVVQQSAQRQMQTIADALADKYVGDPIKQALSGAAQTASAAKAAKTETKSEAPAKTETTEAPKKTAEPEKAAVPEAAAPKPTPTKTPLAGQTFREAMKDAAQKAKDPEEWKKRRR